MEAEIIALRHQVTVLQRSRTPKRLALKPGDRCLWVWLSRLWSGWRSALIIVKPETVIGWHRQGFRWYWTWKVRHGKSGRPQVPKETRNLIRTMSRDNSLWGAPRIQSELMKLDIKLSEASVTKYMVRSRKPPSQTWRAFLQNHLAQLASVDFFTVHTIWFEVLFVFIVLAHDRRRVLHKQLAVMNINEVLSAPRSPWQRAYVERIIGSIRRECLDHVIIFDEESLRCTLRSYFSYYHRSRLHLSLERDPPESRPVQSVGRVVAFPEVGGLHHRYERRAA